MRKLLLRNQRPRLTGPWSSECGCLLFSTDYPDDDMGDRMKFKDVDLLQANEKISEPDKRLICCENASRLFKLP